MSGAQDQRGLSGLTELICIPTTHTIILTPPKQYYQKNLTPNLHQFINDNNIRNGPISAHCLHTTAGLAINEYECGLVHTDVPRILEKLIPSNHPYEHDDLEKRTDVQPDEPKNAPAHIKSILISPGPVIIQVLNGKPDFGTWQSLIYFDWDGRGQERRVTFTYNRYYLPKS